MAFPGTGPGPGSGTVSSQAAPWLSQAGPSSPWDCPHHLARCSPTSITPQSRSPAAGPAAGMLLPQALTARHPGDKGMEWLGTIEQAQPHGWGWQGITAWPGSALEVRVWGSRHRHSPSREPILLLSAALAGTAPLQRMPGSEMYPGLTAAAWPAAHTALAHSALGLTAGLRGPPQTPGGWRGPGPAQAHTAVS